jgi:hypothetical protein
MFQADRFLGSTILQIVPRRPTPRGTEKRREQTMKEYIEALLRRELNNRTSFFLAIDAEYQAATRPQKAGIWGNSQLTLEQLRDKCRDDIAQAAKAIDFYKSQSIYMPIQH